MTTAKALVENDGKWLSVPKGSSTKAQLCSALGTLVEDEYEDDRADIIVPSAEDEQAAPNTNCCRTCTCDCVQREAPEMSTQHLPQVGKDERGAG